MCKESCAHTTYLFDRQIKRLKTNNGEEHVVQSFFHKLPIR
jgi:hypothetical protein